MGNVVNRVAEIWLCGVLDVVPPWTTSPHLGILHEHVLTRNAKVIQLQVTVVDLIKAKLGPNVSHRNTCRVKHGELHRLNLSVSLQTVNFIL